MQLAALCWMHAVIGWGFFILQSWIPMYLQSLGVGSLGNAGLLASLPWLAAAGVGAVAGSFADKMIQTGRPRLYVRRLMHGVSSLGCAAALAPLASSAAPSPVVATLCLVGATACYAFSFGGFHAYVQVGCKPGWPAGC